MKEENKPKKFQILLFVLVFALGVMVGKVLTDVERSLSKKKEQLLVGEPNPISKKEESKISNNTDSDTIETGSSEIGVEETKGVDNGIEREKEKAVTMIIPEFPKIDPGGKYTVQIGSFQNVDNAYKLLKSLIDKDYSSFVSEAVIPERGTWYRVRVGTFNDKKKARDYAEKIKNREKLKLTLITLNN